MSTPIERKPKGECLLKNLPPARQQALYEFMEGCQDEKGHTYKECIFWLAQDGIQTDKAKLSKWRQWYLLRLRFQSCRETAREILEEGKEEGEQITPEQIQRAGNKLFATRAIQDGDDEAWARVQTLELRKEAITALKSELELKWQKYKDQVQASKEVIAREMKAAQTSGGISPETMEKIERELKLL